MAGLTSASVNGTPLPQPMSRMHEPAGSVAATASASATPTVRPLSVLYQSAIRSNFRTLSASDSATAAPSGEQCRGESRLGVQYLPMRQEHTRIASTVRVLLQALRNLVSPEGIEPSTCRLRVPACPIRQFHPRLGWRTRKLVPDRLRRPPVSSACLACGRHGGRQHVGC